MRHHIGTRNARGAAALEFALVVPILLAVAFGIIDYGIWFSNSLSARQASREIAREAAIGNFSTTTVCGSSLSEIERLACKTREQAAPLSGTAYAMVKYTTWAQGNLVTVCSYVNSASTSGLTPLPNGGWAKSESQFSIEAATAPAGAASYADPLPSATGVNWSWCS